tara:strand:+ start:671 stop:922 length:252 start_codon:yes stop_codon:yes gene_type:complete
MSDIRDKWTIDIKEFLIGKKITHVRYMSKSEMKETGWYKNSIMIFFDDGSWINPMQDDEGNDGGALATSSETLPVIPVIGQED